MLGDLGIVAANDGRDLEDETVERPIQSCAARLRTAGHIVVVQDVKTEKLRQKLSCQKLDLSPL